MKLFAHCLLFAAATPALAESALPAGSYPDPSDGMAAHHITLPNQPSAKQDARAATDDVLKGTPQMTQPNDGMGLGTSPAPMPQPKEKAGPEVV